MVLGKPVLWVDGHSLATPLAKVSTLWHRYREVRSVWRKCWGLELTSTVKHWSRRTTQDCEKSDLIQMQTHLYTITREPTKNLRQCRLKLMGKNEDCVGIYSCGRFAPCPTGLQLWDLWKCVQTFTSFCVPIWWMLRGYLSSVLRLGDIVPHVLNPCIIQKSWRYCLDTGQGSYQPSLTTLGGRCCLSFSCVADVQTAARKKKNSFLKATQLVTDGNRSRTRLANLIYSKHCLAIALS